MPELTGTTGLILNEPLLWEKGKKGRSAFSLPRRDVESVPVDEETAGIMITNPNTLGLFEENIKAIAEIVHSKHGQVYCDGANMNAA